MNYKNILIIVNNKNKERVKKFFLENFKKSQNNFSFWEYQEGEKQEGKLVTVDLIFNFLEAKEFDEVQKKIERLKINFWGNSFLSQKIFENKADFKKILESQDFKTPIFEKIKNRKAKDLFLNFPMPARIFSPDNSYFSDKLENLLDIQNIFKEKFDLYNYYIEEYKEGEEIFVFQFELFFGEKSFLIAEKTGSGFKKLSENEFQEIKGKTEKLINLMELKDFAFFHLLKDKKNNFYFLNNYTQLKNIIEKKEILEEIFKLYHLEFPKKLFEKKLF